MICVGKHTTNARSSSIQHSYNEHCSGKSTTYCERFGEPGTEIIENDSDDVLVRDVRIASLQEHFPRPY